jgi:prepilin-type N-terminal cleavage/methylation domain-containing protein
MKKKKNRGFTIVEMIVTLAILAIMFTLSLGIGRSSMQRATFTSAYNQFIADFYYARQMASKEGRYVAMVFDPFGRFYTIRIQTTIDADLTDDANYLDVKKVEPLGGAEFFTGAFDFAFNSTGTVRSYPVNVDSAPISFSMTIFKKDEASGKMDFQKTVWIYPSGGIKLEK